MRIACALVLVGCGGGGTGTLDAGASDAGPADAQQCFGLYTYCLASAPATEVVLRDVIDTATDARCDPGIATTCVIAGRDVIVSQALGVTAGRPLAIVGRTIQIDGSIILAKTLDVAANCAAPASPAVSRAGGAGGSFGTRGGDGGSGLPGAGGVASAANASPTALRGGCPGGADTATSGLTTNGLALIATQQITIYADAWIDACGSGGFGPALGSGNGAGGGGSGGMIVLDAPAIQIDGNVLAMGGGGGGGAGPSSGNATGTSACDKAANLTPSGGVGPSSTGGVGGTTGDGAAGGSAASAAAGGGGGAGLILVRGVVAGTGMIIPPMHAP